MAPKSLIHLADGSVKDDIDRLCRSTLIRESKDIPIVYIVQPPEMKRCWLSLYKQLLKGLETATTDYVGICEQDVLYSSEHLEWIPPTDDAFYYNVNTWFYQYSSKNHPECDGMYSFWANRLALSQLVCNRELLKKSVTDRLNFLNNDVALEGEFGALVHKLKKRAEDGSSAYLKAMDKYIDEQPPYKTFKTKIPNVDIRHESNFTGARRGNKRRFEIPYWGKLEDLWH